MRKNICKLGDIAEITTGGTPNRKQVRYWSDGQIPWLTTSCIDFCTINAAEEFITEEGLKNSAAKIMPAGTLLMAMYGQGATRGKIAKLAIPAAFNQACAAITVDTKKCDPDYLYYFLESKYEEIRELGHGGNQKNLNTSLIKKEIFVFLPSVNQQKKIAAILRTWDEAIEETQNLIRRKEHFLSWFRGNVCTGKIRIKNFTQPWQKVSSKSVLFEHKHVSTGKECVHSVSVHKGVVDQIEHLGRSFAAQDTSKYNRVHFGDIIYTKSPTGDFPWGIIKQSRQKKDVIVSPLYGVFRPATHELGLFLDFFFESDKYTRNYLRSLIQKGAKNTINITNTRFLEGTIFIPSDQKELREIAKAIFECRSEIQILTKKMEMLKAQKRGLMQKLLTGEWPVRVEKEAA